MAYYPTTDEFIYEGETAEKVQEWAPTSGSVTWNTPSGPKAYNSTIYQRSCAVTDQVLTVTMVPRGGIIPPPDPVSMSYSVGDTVGWGGMKPPGPGYLATLASDFTVPSNQMTALPVSDGEDPTLFSVGGKFAGTVVWDASATGAREISYRVRFVPRTGPVQDTLYRITSGPGLANAYAEQNFWYQVPVPTFAEPGHVYGSLMVWQNSGSPLKVLTHSRFFPNA